jgi:hypothetical protein
VPASLLLATHSRNKKIRRAVRAVAIVATPSRINDVSHNNITMDYDAYSAKLDSVGNAILTWADPQSQFRGYTDVSL